MYATLIAGLGNPGRSYAGTRHNLGFVIVDALAAAERLSWKHESRFDAEVARWESRPGVTRWLVKPQTFMNECSRTLGRLIDFYKVPIDDLTVAYDDFTIDVGLVKISVRGSSGGHNGIANLLKHLGNGFSRFRLGINSPRPADMDIADFVLGKFSPSEQFIIDQTLPTFVSSLCLLLDQGPDRAMNILNRRKK